MLSITEVQNGDFLPDQKTGGGIEALIPAIYMEASLIIEGAAGNWNYL